ncbi:DUF429 domain-containing protein [Waterburya agarophytonicola K14]|uniref:DUF429 domain-containing protein n=1 Tax=Waterburya agarophytonicola KI4 TaxID=2874699 RepID=A0A964FE81_9CYAN|nr:DUF429 domain-containing protein [Waterburya agarophytonicola]MCC0175572.1 DUF429 domain-containing protein [Waterburya agarophytonicola KI4]
MKFIGVDFGWTSGASGLCCLILQGDQLKIETITTVLEMDAILDRIDEWISPDAPGLIAVDAPTIINNQTGMRLPDKLTHKHFGRYHAGCYPANLNLGFSDRTVGFGNSLTARNFHHAPTIQSQELGRYQIEVFPHPATINLFGLNKILKYKKGRIAERKIELNKLRNYIIDILPKLEPALQIDPLDEIPVIPHQITGKELKAIEDKLDSLICAYVAAHWWYWGEAKNMVLGNIDSGYIVIPQK